MPIMTTRWTPDPETAEVFALYAEAVRTERDLKPDVRQRAEAALKAGATSTQLARLTGMTPEVFRRMARDLRLPIDPRYAERAAASRKKPAIQQSETPNEPTPAPSGAPALRDDVRALAHDQAAALAYYVEVHHGDWFRAARRKIVAANPYWLPYAITQAAVEADLISLDDPAAE
jgi:hypothetical protein